MKSPGGARVGCSGWQYEHWRGDFYRDDLPQSRWFEHYATVFDTVEINNSFYRLPESGTFAKWAFRAPSGFVFAVKASRFLTHMKKLKDPEEPIDRGGWPSRLKLDIDHATLGNLAHTDATAGHAGERVGDAEPALQRV